MIQQTETRTHQDPGAAVRSAQQLQRAGRPEEAEAAWRAILAAYPDSLPAATALARLLAARNERVEAAQVVRGLITAAPTHQNVTAVARLWEAWQDHPVPGTQTLRVALTGTGTLAPLSDHLRVSTAQLGLHPAVYTGDFNQWAQDLLAPESPLYEFAPELIVVLLEPAALFPRNLDSGSTPEDAAAEREAGIAQIAQLFDAVRRHRPTATLLFHTFAQPDRSPHGISDLPNADGQTARFQAINEALAVLARERPSQVLLFDQERAEARHGKSRVRDDRLWYLASVPFSDTFLPVLAAEYVRVIRPLKGLVRKCVVLDLDNTLWGGVIGEDGIDQIKLGGSAAPGNAFLDFQRALDGLRRQGVLLAISSKNNPEDVWPVLEAHPHMVLRRECFAAARINWNDKASNLVELARELNIGLDSLVFLDDNPAERAQVRQRLPEVLTVELPRDPALYTRTLLGLDVFETLSVTAEDTQRGRLYAEQSAREAVRQQLGSGGDMAAYLANLDIRVRMEAATPFTLPRIAQLINKTNQFNLTTRRYTEAEVRAMADDPARWGIYAVTVSDRFGDSGLTGVALVRKGALTWEIDSFLLSCRVLGRGIEDALLTHVIREAQAAGAALLEGAFIPSEKNAPAAGFYAAQQFAPAPAVDDKPQVWRLELGEPAAGRDFPQWLTVEA
ncbi:MAG: hypothetical protein K0Q72_340 [Armatimonadetes bacterium]|nr:hypothetical protein [Armatimonadota bacterium]